MTGIIRAAFARFLRKQDDAARDDEDSAAKVSRWRRDEDNLGDEAEAWLRDGGLQ